MPEDMTRNETLEGPAGPGSAAQAADPVATGPLGNYADLSCLEFTPIAPPTTVKAFYLRNIARQLLVKSGPFKRRQKKDAPVSDENPEWLAYPRLRWCGSRIERAAKSVNVYARPDRAYGRVSGVCTCGQSIVCPVCAPRIAAFRAAEVAEAFRLARGAGFEARMIARTMPHAKGSPLSVEIEDFSRATKFFRDTRSARRRGARCRGYIDNREVTYGVHGWHFHGHELRFDEPGTFREELARAQWLSSLDFVSRRKRGVDERAFHCQLVQDEHGAEYVSKVTGAVEIALETASGATKSRNISTLLAMYAGGDQEAGKVWLEGVRAITTRKVSALRWSRGLKSSFGLADEKTDDQIALEEALETDVFLGALNPLQWRGVLRWKAEFSLLIAAQRGEEAVNEFLRGLGLGNLNDEVPERSIEELNQGVSKC